MPSTDTPLRYPGGKTQLAPFVGELLSANQLQGAHYAEPFAGGAGIAWRLLFSGQVSELWLNDIDPAVYAFWQAAVYNAEALCERIQTAVFTMAEWHRQRSLFRDSATPALARGFAALYMNRTNRSGILDGGAIGGQEQTGNYKMDCRFNKADLCRKVRRMGRYREVVHLSNHDARLHLAQLDKKLPARSLINIDPPYFGKGSELYTNHFQPADHGALAVQVRRLKNRWMLTYDDAPEIERLYAGLPQFRKGLRYSAQVKRNAQELLVLSPQLNLPRCLQSELAA